MAPASRISQSQSLRVAGSVFGTIFIAFGLNAILNPLSALTFFEIHPPSSSSSSSTSSSSSYSDYSTDQTLIDSLMIIYGARDIFMGLAIYSAAYFGNEKDNQKKKNKAFGWILIAASGVAFVDGGVCKMIVGKGEWNHWGYAPVLAAVGLGLLGVFDRGE